LKSSYVDENCVPAIVYNITVNATKPGYLKTFIDDIVHEIFAWYP